ncbi:DUF4145 domain-containing protein [Priestia megaterium]
MTDKLPGNWHNSIGLTEISFTCGHCGTYAGPSKGYYCSEMTTHTQYRGHIYICPNCNKPTFLNEITKEQVPGPKFGNELSHLPEDVEQLYNEARNCVSVNAFTSSILSCRKILMNVAVSKGAEAGKSFAFYVNFLDEHRYIPPDSKEWVDHIRDKGNEATHEIPSMSKTDALELLHFTEMLLRFVYEMPGEMQKYTRT